MFTVGLEGAGFHPMLVALIIVAVVSWAILLFCILNIKPAGVLPNAYFNF